MAKTTVPNQIPRTAIPLSPMQGGPMPAAITAAQGAMAPPGAAPPVKPKSQAQRLYPHLKA